MIPNSEVLYGYEITGIIRIEWVEVQGLKIGGPGSFDLVLTEPEAERLRNDGWTIKEWSAHPEDPEWKPKYSLHVNLYYFDKDRRLKPEDKVPHVFQLIGNRREELIDPSDVADLLTNGRFKSIEVVVNPRWNKNKPGTVSAYVEQMLLELYPVHKYTDHWADRFPLGMVDDPDEDLVG